MMSYIQQQQQPTAGTDQSGVMTSAYEVQISEVKHHIQIPNDNPGRSINNNNESSDSIEHINNQQHHANTLHGGDSNGIGDNEANHSSSSGADSEDKDNKSLAMQSPSGDGTKTPNSYKYPLLRRYYEFGPWVGRNRKAVCLACSLQTSSSQPDRLLKHLNRCTALTDEDKSVVSELMNDRTANKRKKAQLRARRDNDDNDSEYYGQDEPGLSDGDTSHCQNSSSFIQAAGSIKKHKTEHQDRNSQIDEALTRFIMMCRIPLKAVHSPEFIEFVRALNPDYRIPSRETITNVLIPGLLNII